MPTNNKKMERKTLNKIKYQWFSGLVDGDGTFSFSLNNKEKLRWNCTDGCLNARMLYYCRDLIGCGSVNLRAGVEAAEFRIRGRKLLQSVIRPL